MMRTFTVLFGMSCLLLADDELKQKVQVVHTERMDLPAGGTVRLTNSTGELTVEAWDEPGVEITTIKSTKAEFASSERENAVRGLDMLRIAAERRAGELVITTYFPRHRGFPPASPLATRTFDLEYHIKVPRDARLVVDHDVGDLHFDGVSGDIHATILRGEMTLLLPAGDQYTLDAKSDFGSVTSDFPGNAKRRFWLVGNQYVQSSQAPHALYLRVGFGDIVILKISKPQRQPRQNQQP